MRRFIIWLHRYLGIPMSAVFVVWFVSGIVMMYAGGMPTVTPEQRLQRLAPIDIGAIAQSPSAAARAAGLTAVPGAVSVHTVLGRPAYHFGGRGRSIVFADNGDVLETVSREAARREAARFVNRPPDALRYVGAVTEPDQWTLAQRGNLPLERFDVDDAARTRVYVAMRSGEVTLVTDRKSRALAWLGTIPHWFYFTPLRLDQPLWYWTVVGVSGLGCVLAALGLVLGVTQFRRSKPFSLAKSIRYRGLMRWHYYTGAIFGVFALTWVFSGLLSMEPFAWTSATGLSIDDAALEGEPVDIDAYAELAAVDWPRVLGAGVLPKEIEYVQVAGEPYFAVRATAEAGTAQRERLHQPYPVARNPSGGPLLVHAAKLEARHEPFDSAMLVTRLGAAAGDVAIESDALLTEYDAYYYSRGGQAPLPVLRVKFADPASTWYYVDPRAGRIVARTHRYSRLERWLFNGLHSLDFAFWYDRRPLWDVGMILLSLGALGTSVIGMWLGFKRLRPKRRATRVVEA